MNTVLPRRSAVPFLMLFASAATVLSTACASPDEASETSNSNLGEKGAPPAQCGDVAKKLALAIGELDLDNTTLKVEGVETNDEPQVLGKDGSTTTYEQNYLVTLSSEGEPKGAYNVAVKYDVVSSKAQAASCTPTGIQDFALAQAHLVKANADALAKLRAGQDANAGGADKPAPLPEAAKAPTACSDLAAKVALATSNFTPPRSYSVQSTSLQETPELFQQLNKKISLYSATYDVKLETPKEQRLQYVVGIDYIVGAPSESARKYPCKFTMLQQVPPATEEVSPQ